MASTLEEMARGEKCAWAITLKDGDDEMIGRIDLWADDGEQRDQRGFWLDPEFWGRGLMTEAANRVTDFALLELGWPQPVAQQRRGQRRLAPGEGEAGRDNRRAHAAATTSTGTASGSSGC